MSATGNHTTHAADTCYEHTPAPSSQSPEGPPRGQKNRWRRARRACLSCRARKVRCDVLQRAPCGNCAWDNLECVVVRRRNSTYYSMGKPAAPPQDTLIEEDEDGDFETKNEPSAQNPTLMELTDAATIHPTPMPCDESGGDVASADEMLGVLAASVYGQSPASCVDSPIQEETNEQLLSQPSAPPGPKLLDTPDFMHLPGFIKPLSTRLAMDDLAFLHSKGALNLPSRDCQDALLWSFFEYVYPFMPILDLDQFLQAVENDDGKAGKISLLLFQAVLFTGTAHVPLHHLQSAGFTTRKNARKAFFQRVRFLYDFNTETDHLVLVQALLLMTLWYETPDEHRNTWHWIDVSISQAFSAGLNQDPSYFKSKYSPRVQRLRRRIWWACFMRDRVVSLGMRRPPRIRDDDYNVSILEESDFKPVAWQRGTPRRDICSYADDKKKRHELACLCVEKAKLCRCWRHYVRTHYTIFSENADSGTEIFRVPKLSDTDIFAACNEDLLKWHSALPESCKYTSLTDENNGGDSTVALNRTILHMVYFSAVASLHRSRFTALSRDPNASLFEQEMSKLSMQNAATHISSMAGTIHNSGMDIFLPTLGISILVSAAVIHLLEMKGVIQADKRAAFKGYRRCMSVIESLKDMYVVADLAKDAMEWAFIEPLGHEHPSSHYTSSVIEPSRNLATKSADVRESETCPEHSSASDATSSNFSLVDGVLVEGTYMNGYSWGDSNKKVKETSCLPEAQADTWSGFNMEELEGFESCVMFSGMELQRNDFEGTRQ